MAAANMEKKPVSAGEISSVTVVPEVYGHYDDSNAYVSAGVLWEGNLNIQLYLRPDGNLAREGLTASKAASAISAAAETWDGETTKELFKNNVIISAYAAADKFDGKNVNAWKYIPSDTIAYSRRYYYTNLYVTGADGQSYNKMAESDICFNTKWSWTTNQLDSRLYLKSNTFDVQTVACHELGHTLGLREHISA